MQPSPRVVKAKRIEIARRYARQARKRRSPRQLATLRVAEIDRLFTARYGHTIPDDDAGRDDIAVMAHHLAGTGRAMDRAISRWIGERAPWFTQAETNRLIADVATCPLRWKADNLAWRLRLTYADRQALKIKTIGSIDVSRAARAKMRKAKSKARSKAWRAARKAAADAANAT